MDMEQEKILSQFAAVDLQKDQTQVETIPNKESLPKNKMKMPNFLNKPWQKVLFAFALIAIIITASLITYTLIMVISIKKEIDQAKPIAFEAKNLIAAQNLKALPEKIGLLQTSKNKILAQYQKLSFYNYLPVLKNYYQDGQKLLEVADHGFIIATKGTDALIPYLDLLGFSGEGSFTGGTTQDRIVLILETLKQIQPTIDEIDNETKIIASTLNEIDANHYPKKVAGQEIRAKVVDVQKQAKLFSQTFSDYKPVIASLGKMAGAEKKQKYLVLFQNDNELRPTGGFLTAYAIINIEKGVVTSEKSDDIYELDQKQPNKINRFVFILERTLN